MTQQTATRPPASAVLALVAAPVGTGIMGMAFPAGVRVAELGGNALPYEIAFVVAAALVVAALVVGVVNLVRGRARALSVIAIVLALIPIVATVVIAIAANR